MSNEKTSLVAMIDVFLKWYINFVECGKVVFDYLPPPFDIQEQIHIFLIYAFYRVDEKKDPCCPDEWFIIEHDDATGLGVQVLDLT